MPRDKLQVHFCGMLDNPENERVKVTSDSKSTIACFCVMAKKPHYKAIFSLVLKYETLLQQNHCERIESFKIQNI